MNRRAVGTQYESLAGEFLKQKGHTILEWNYRIRSGEIDLITKDKEYLVFVEVKYRRNRSCGEGMESVTIRKQDKIIRTAEHYLLTHGYTLGQPCRFDVISITGDKVMHLENAFEV